jgi:hypothetical protein
MDGRNTSNMKILFIGITFSSVYETSKIFYNNIWWCPLSKDLQCLWLNLFLVVGVSFEYLLHHVKLDMLGVHKSSEHKHLSTGGYYIYKKIVRYLKFNNQKVIVAIQD